MLSFRNARRAAALVAIGGATFAPVPTAALATSAGDQQYVDPLSGSNGSSGSSHHSSGSGSSSSSSGSTGSSGSSGSSGSTGSLAASSGLSGSGSSGTVGTTAAGGSTGTTSGKTLPFTGYDGGLAVTLGTGLVAGGVLLRRRTASAQR